MKTWRLLVAVLMSCLCMFASAQDGGQDDAQAPPAAPDANNNNNGAQQLPSSLVIELPPGLPGPSDINLGATATDDGAASTPAAETSSADPNSGSSESGGLSNTAKIALGVSLPVGGIILAACIFVLLNKKRRCCKKGISYLDSAEQSTTTIIAESKKPREAPEAPRIYTKLTVDLER